MKRDQAMMRRVVIDRCQACGANGAHRHHIVPRRLTQCDDPENLVVLCGDCHGAVHDKTMDLGPCLRPSQAAKAVLLMPTLHSAHMLLYPSEYKVVA